MISLESIFPRRSFLLGAAGLGAASVARGFQNTAPAPVEKAPTPPKAHWLRSTTPRLAHVPSYEKLIKPVALVSQSGSLAVQLQCGYSYHNIGQDSVHLRTYNNSGVGPALYVRPGDTLHVSLANELPPSIPACACPETDHSHMDDPPQGTNNTNLHTHGLHVSPSGSSDNVFVQVCPNGGSFAYEYKIPDDHPAGTFWYHPHKHGSAAVQVANGMAGALIVLGAIDEFFAKRGIEDQILLFQQVPYSKKTDGQFTSEWSDIVAPNTEPYTLINGQLNPTITIDAGAIYRWRLIHGGISETIPFTIVRQGGASSPFYRVAVDGLTTGTVDQMTTAQLGPGYRYDVLVQLEPGTYKLLKPASPNASRLNNQVPENAQELATIEVRAHTGHATMPTNEEMKAFVPHLPAFPTTPPVRPVQLGYAKNGGWQFCAKNGVDQSGPVVCEKYNPSDAVLVKLGTQEQWQIVNTDPYNAHPFHIHVNPFLVTKIAYDPAWVDYYTKLGYTITQLPINPKDFVWRDTILIYPCQKVTFNTSFDNFDGTFVMHCHILRHEDEGMMRNVQIDKDPTTGMQEIVVPPSKPGRPS